MTNRRPVPWERILAASLLLLSLVSPWWVLTSSLSVTGVGEQGSAQMEFGWMGGWQRVASTYGSSDTPLDYSQLPTVRLVFNWAAGFLIVAIVLSLLGLAARYISIPALERSEGLFVLIAFGMCLAAAVHVTTALPSAVVQDYAIASPLFDGFWGANVVPEGANTWTYRWGGALGWFASVFAAPLLVWDSLTTFLTARRASRIFYAMAESTYLRSQGRPGYQDQAHGGDGEKPLPQLRPK